MILNLSENIVVIKKNPYSMEYEVKLIDYESVIKKKDDYGTFYTHGFLDYDLITDLEDNKLIKNTEYIIHKIS